MEVNRNSKFFQSVGLVVEYEILWLTGDQKKQEISIPLISLLFGLQCIAFHLGLPFLLS